MRTLKRYAPVLAVALVAAIAVPVVVQAAPDNIDRAVRAVWGGLQIGKTGTKIDDSYAVSAVTLDIASVAAVTCLDTTLGTAVTGAAVGDVCVLGLPASPQANLGFSCFVSAADTVKIRACNPTAGALDPASAAYSVRVFDP